MSRCALSAYERALEREGLAHLDYDDGGGGIRVGNRGSGKVLDESRAFGRREARERAEQRETLVAAYLDRHLYSPRDTEYRALKLYAAGISLRAIEKRTGIGYGSVFRLVTRVEREHRDSEQTVAELVAACEPSTLVLVFTLIETALDQPDRARLLLTKARSIPELRSLLEPEDARNG